MPTKARNVVLVHGLFADGSCRTEVIARLQAAGFNMTSVQNPLTTLPDAVASAQRVLARQDGAKIARSIRTWSASWRGEWAPRRLR
jgi:hypothetical protein